MNDNSKDDTLPFIHIAALTANVVRYLSKRDQKTEDERNESERKANERAKAEGQRRKLCVA